MKKENIVIYEDKKGNVKLRADIQKDTIWATGVLREYLKRGYALDRSKLERTPEAVEGLGETLALMGSTKYPGKSKGSLVFKLSKKMEPKK